MIHTPVRCGILHNLFIKSPKKITVEYGGQNGVNLGYILPPTQTFPRSATIGITFIYDTRLYSYP